MSLRLAIHLATQSRFKYRLGAVVVKSGRVLSTGVNEIRFTHFNFPKKHEISLHAEQAAILKLLRTRRMIDLCGATLYVSRIDSKGNPRLAKPCPICLELIHTVGIKRTVYTTSDGIGKI